VIGDPMFDKIGTLVREPLSDLMSLPHVDAIIERRVKQITKHFNLDAELILKWTYVHTVMAICWCIEDNQDYSLMLKFLTKI
jgi:streptomycin 6-kinase